MFYKSMKKNCKMKHSRMFSVSCKLLLASGFILLIGIMFAPTIACGQQKDKLISLKLDGESVLDAIQKINRQSGNSISYKKEELEKESKRVTVNLKDAKVLAAGGNRVERNPFGGNCTWRCNLDCTPADEYRNGKIDYVERFRDGSK